MSKRCIGIDVLKCIACLLVICIHSGPFKPIMADSNIYKYLAGFIDQVARVAVPFFFVASSYLFAQSKNKNFFKMANKLLSIFIVWSFIYIIFPSEYVFTNGYVNAVTLKLSELVESPFKLIFEGGRSHLWFLMALILAVLIFVKMRTHHAMITGGLLYIIGCLLGSYSKLIFGYDLHSVINTRNGIFISGFCWAIGQYIYAIKMSDTSKFDILKKYAGVLMVMGFLGHFFEIYFLNKIGGISFIRHDYVISTVIFAFGFFLVGLKVSGNLISDRESIYISHLSKLTLGIYLLHPIVIDLFNFFIVPSISSKLIMVWQIMFVIFTFTISAGATQILSKSKYFRKFI